MVLTKNFHHISEVDSIVPRVLRVYQDVIDVDENMLVQNKENYQSIHQTKGHDLKFKTTILTAERHHQYILDPDLYLIITRSEMDFGKHQCT